MKLSELLKQNKLSLSFEVFPPKTDTAFESVKRATEQIAELHPSFVSVTYGAGGGTSKYTLDIAKNIKQEHGVPTLAHLTCVSSTKATVKERIEDIKNAGADIITVHAEACTHLDRVVNQIKEAGCKAGVALNPATPVSVLECILGQVDMVLIMTVNPGFGGQKFIPYTLEKVKQVRAMCDEKGLTADIQVDGGISAANVREVLEAGANVFVAGSAVFGSDPAARVKEFNEIFKEYEK